MPTGLVLRRRVGLRWGRSPRRAIDSAQAVSLPSSPSPRERRAPTVRWRSAFAGSPAGARPRGVCPRCGPATCLRSLCGRPGTEWPARPLVAPRPERLTALAVPLDRHAVRAQVAADVFDRLAVWVSSSPSSGAVEPSAGSTMATAVPVRGPGNGLLDHLPSPAAQIRHGAALPSQPRAWCCRSSSPETSQVTGFRVRRPAALLVATRRIRPVADVYLRPEPASSMSSLSASIRIRLRRSRMWSSRLCRLLFDASTVTTSPSI